MSEDLILARGVVESEPISQQGDAPLGQPLGRAIGMIADDGTADGRQLGPDLMAPAGFQCDLQQALALVLLYQPVGQNGTLAVRGRVGFSAAQAANAGQIVLQPTAGLRRAPRDDRQIGFGDCPLPELSAQAGRGFGGARQNQHSGHGPIQPVDHAHKGLAGFGVTLLDIALGQFHHAGVVLDAALH